MKQGVLHNPKSDRRTTQGIFHVAEGGLADSGRQAGGAQSGLRQDAAAGADSAARTDAPAVHGHATAAGGMFRFVAAAADCLPGSAGFTPEKTMEIRFFAPGQPGEQPGFRGKHFRQCRRSVLAGERCRAGCGTLDRPHRLRHSRAASRSSVDQETLGLPRWDQATERQRRDGMCWKDEGELYNDGRAFKLTCRDESGVIVTIIADNYFGYCKKEVKTQISFAANLLRACAKRSTPAARWCFRSYDLGEEFSGDVHVKPHGPHLRGSDGALRRV